jgi:hypothetical protein
MLDILLVQHRCLLHTTGRSHVRLDSSTAPDSTSATDIPRIKLLAKVDRQSLEERELNAGSKHLKDSQIEPQFQPPNIRTNLFFVPTLISVDTLMHHGHTQQIIELQISANRYGMISTYYNYSCNLTSCTEQKHQ